MRAALLIVLAPAAFAAPTLAQGMDPSMPGMSMPTPAARAGAKPSPKTAHRHKPHRGTRRAHHAAPASSAGVHTGHDMADMPGVTMPPAQGPAGMAGAHDGHPAASADAGADQGMASMPGMAMPGMSQDQPAAGGDHGMATMPGMKGMDISSQPPAPAAEQPVGNEPPPPPPTDHAADRVFGQAAMAGPREQVHREHGGATWSMALANLAEYQSGKGGGYRWEGEASFGGDINRLFLKSEGEGTARSSVDAAEIQALYSRAIGPYFNLQAGVRQDFRPTPERTYATLGLEGLAPYWFEVSGAVFLSTKGEVLGRLEGYDDFRLTQRLILQPRAEMNLSAQNTPQLGIGSGVTNLELGLRLRCEITREFAPYIGVSYDRKFGATADYARARGQDAGAPTFVAGIRTFF